MSKIIFKILICIGLLAIGFGVGRFSHINTSPRFESVHENSDLYKFINPILFVKVPEDQAFPEYMPLKKHISEYADRMITSGLATNISVYFRNLNSSQWIYIHPDEKFNPASMLKVIVLVSALRGANVDQKLLPRTVTIGGDDSVLVGLQTSYHPPAHPVHTDGTYSIQTLINQMIIESDNVASAVLAKEVGDDEVNKTYDDLELHHPALDGEGYTAKEYSRVFRTLYNGTYLPRSVSEQVLTLLSKTTYNEGLVKLLPKDTVVSHKFGVDADTSGGPERQLHDCGIVYYPKKPYFICVMTKGTNYSDLESVIQNISRIAWDDVASLDN